MADWPSISELRALLVCPTNLRIMTTDDWNQCRVDILATGMPYEVLTHPDCEYGYWTRASLLRLLDDLGETIEARGADVENGQAETDAITIAQIPAYATSFDDGQSQATESGDASSAAHKRSTTTPLLPPTCEENDGDSEEEDHTSKFFTGHAMTKKDADGVVPDPKAKKPWNCPVKGCNVASTSSLGRAAALPLPRGGMQSGLDRVRPHVRNVHPQIVLLPRLKPITVESSAAPAPTLVQKKRARGGDEDDVASNSKRRRITTS